jgi:hypothetical protein
MNSLVALPYITIILGLGIAFSQWITLKSELSSKRWFLTNSVSICLTYLLLNSFAHHRQMNIFYFDNDVNSVYICWTIGAAVFLVGVYTFLRNKFEKAWWYILAPIVVGLLGNVIDFTLLNIIPNQSFVPFLIGVFAFSLLSLWIIKPSLLKKKGNKKIIVVIATTLVFLLAEALFNHYRYSRDLGDRSNNSSVLIVSLTIIIGCISSGLVMDWLVRTQKKSSQVNALLKGMRQDEYLN